MGNRSIDQGFSIVEIVVAAAIILTLVGTAAEVWQLYFKVSRINEQETQSTLLTEEAAEALNVFRDNGWTANIWPLFSHIVPPSSTKYYLYWNDANTKYSTSTTPVIVNDIYTVSFVLTPVYRDSSSNICPTPTTSCGGAIDPKTVKADITVTASTSEAVKTMSSSLLLHDIYND